MGREARGVVELPSQAFTQLLIKWRCGDREALHALVPVVYNELRNVAHRHLQRERPGHTLQSTALVHEAYLRLVDQAAPDMHNRSHFVAIAACLMRQILVDYARGRSAKKRGQELRADVNFEECPSLPNQPGPDLPAVDDALNALAERDAQQARIVELRYFGGLTIEETAQVLEISPATVKRDWNVAKAWLAREMRRGSRGESGEAGAVGKS
jgi:RNA polymerase sigma factor (TIGR02999 family)